MGDLAYQNLLINIFEDDAFNCKRLELELIEYQKIHDNYMIFLSKVIIYEY